MVSLRSQDLNAYYFIFWLEKDSIACPTDFAQPAKAFLDDGTRYSLRFIYSFLCTNNFHFQSEKTSRDPG